MNIIDLEQPKDNFLLRKMKALRESRHHRKREYPQDRVQVTYVSLVPMGLNTFSILLNSSLTARPENVAVDMSKGRGAAQRHGANKLSPE